MSAQVSYARRTQHAEYNALGEEGLDKATASYNVVCVRKKGEKRKEEKKKKRVTHGGSVTGPG